MDRELSVTEHLEELRRRVIIALVSIGAATLASVPFSSYLLKVLKTPAYGVIQRLVFFSPEEAFSIYMRISFLSGLVMAFPVVLYQFWAFVSPAIEDKFKSYIKYFVISCSATFAAGCVFAYYVLLPNALKFLLSLGSGELEAVISANRYISFTTGIIFCCGLVFQMPVLSYLLTKVGLIDAGFLRGKFKFALVIVFVIAAVITPTTDVFNMTALAIPMILLYEVSIWVSFLAKRP